MELVIDEKTKEQLTELFVEIIQNKRELFQEIIEDALEDAGLVWAIKDGRKSGFVDESVIFDTLEG